MDIDACVIDVAQLVEQAGSRNGQRWSVDKTDLHAILMKHAAPDPAEDEPEAETTVDEAARVDAALDLADTGD